MHQHNLQCTHLCPAEPQSDKMNIVFNSVKWNKVSAFSLDGQLSTAAVHSLHQLWQGLLGIQEWGHVTEGNQKMVEHLFIVLLVLQV